MKNSIFYILMFFISGVLTGQIIEVVPLDINTEADEFGPCYYKDGLAIVSNRRNNIAKSVVELDDNEQEQFLNDLYFLSSNDELEVHEHFSLESFEHNYPELHEGPATFNSAYDYMVLTETIKSKKQRDGDYVGLFSSKKEGEHWSEPELIPFENKKCNYAQPCLSEDGNTLYFVSDLSGGEGGIDIWYSNKYDGKWSEPINMGSQVNSPDNDVFPFIEKDKFFFSSNRVGTLGGYDIFFLDLTRNRSPKKIEEPINSSSDEFGFITKDFGKSGYFSSNRSGNDDVFKFSVEIAFPDTCEGVVKASRCFLFYEDDISSDTLPYIYKWDFGDGKTGLGHRVRHCFSDAGEYVVNLTLIDTLYNLEISNVGSYEVEVEEYPSYYIESFEGVGMETSSLVAFFNSESRKIEDNTIWKIGEELIYRESDLKLSLEHSGNYEIKAYNNEEDDSTCYKSIVWLDGVSENVINVVPNDYDRVVNKKMKYWIKDCLNQNPNSKFVLKANKHNVDLYDEWVWKLSNYVQDKYGSELIIDIDQRMEKFLLSVN